MRSVFIVLGGILLLAGCVLVARLVGGSTSHWLATGSKVFIPLWLLAAGINMWIGVTRAGYTVAEELPIFLFIFGVPAAVAAFLWWKYGSMH